MRGANGGDDDDVPRWWRLSTDAAGWLRCAAPSVTGATTPPDPSTVARLLALLLASSRASDNDGAEAFLVSLLAASGTDTGHGLASFGLLPSQVPSPFGGCSGNTGTAPVVLVLVALRKALRRACRAYDAPANALWTLRRAAAAAADGPPPLSSLRSSRLPPSPLAAAAGAVEARLLQRAALAAAADVRRRCAATAAVVSQRLLPATDSAAARALLWLCVGDACRCWLQRGLRLWPDDAAALDAVPAEIVAAADGTRLSQSPEAARAAAVAFDAAATAALRAFDGEGNSDDDASALAGRLRRLRAALPTFTARRAVFARAVDAYAAARRYVAAGDGDDGDCGPFLPPAAAALLTARAGLAAAELASHETGNAREAVAIARVADATTEALLASEQRSPSTAGDEEARKTALAARGALLDCAAAWNAALPPPVVSDVAVVRCDGVCRDADACDGCRANAAAAAAASALAARLRAHRRWRRHGAAPALDDFSAAVEPTVGSCGSAAAAEGSADDDDGAARVLEAVPYLCYDACVPVLHPTEWPL